MTRAAPASAGDFALADWYVFQHDDPALGPWSTEDVADAILSGSLAPDVWVAAPGGDRWVRALDIPVIAQRIEGVPTRPRRDSGLRIMPGVYQQNPHMASTVMMVKDDEAALVPSEEFDDDAPPTEPSLPPAAPSSPTPPPTIYKKANGG